MTLRERTIAVTGATGFLGRYVCVTLLRRSARVVGVVRNPSRRPELERDGVVFRVADLGDEEALSRAFRGADAIVANAGLIPQRRDRNFVAVNVDGTANVMRAAHEAGVRRVILVSFVRAWREAGGAMPRVWLPIPVPIRFSYDTTRATADLQWSHTSFREALGETFAIEAAAGSFRPPCDASPRR